MKKLADISLFESLTNTKCVFNWATKWDYNPPRTPEEWLEFADPDGSLGWDVRFVSNLVNVLRNERCLSDREIMNHIEGIAMVDSNLEYYASHGYLGEKFNNLF